MARKYELIFYRKRYVIQEKTTEYVIRQFRPKDKQKAIRYCNFLNSGGAFDGFTPEFILKSKAA